MKCVLFFKLRWCIMASKSICDRCLNRWSSGGKLYCIESQYKYSNSKKECKGFKEGTNDKYWRGKSEENRGKKHW